MKLRAISVLLAAVLLSIVLGSCRAKSDILAWREVHRAWIEIIEPDLRACIVQEPNEAIRRAQTTHADAFGELIAEGAAGPGEE